MMVIFLTYNLQRPDIASAADGNAAATTEIWLDSTHSIIVDYSIDVTYNYDEDNALDRRYGNETVLGW
ncbi:MAG: hypothetical protein ACLRMX_04340 [Lachnospira eligens]